MDVVPFVGPSTIPVRRRPVLRFERRVRRSVDVGVSVWSVDVAVRMSSAIDPALAGGRRRAMLFLAARRSLYGPVAAVHCRDGDFIGAVICHVSD